MKSLNEMKAAIFDMDGTLIDSLGVWEILWDEFGNRYLGGKVFEPKKEDDLTIRTLPLNQAMDLT